MNQQEARAPFEPSRVFEFGAVVVRQTTARLIDWRS
jgi:hypothetical protein